MWQPIRTDRLLLRCPRPEDAEALYRRRNDPELAKWQAWEQPWPLDKAEALIAAVIEEGEPLDDEFWMITVANLADTEVLGDLVIKRNWNGRCVEVGYTLAREHHGKGYATEGTEALVRWAFDQPQVTRVHAMLHPDNPASARVLERNGFRFEGHTRLSFWVGEENSDDWLYGMTRAEWEAWRDRPTSPPTEIRFVEIDESNQYAARRLAVHKSQDVFVAPVVASMADALFPEIIDGAPVVPWMRAVEADGELVGFVMLALVTDAHPEPYLWRLLVDRMHQHRGVGRRIIELLADEVRSTGSTTLMTSWVDGVGSPRRFYEGLGFVETGNIIDGEIEGRLTL